MSDEQHQNSAVCRLYRKTGGAAVIAGTDHAAYETGKIEIIPSGQTYRYQFLSWMTSYYDPASWVKTAFDYRLELTLHTYEEENDKWNIREFVIDTRDPESIADNLLPLEVMYGCVAPDTMITMNDGMMKKICDVRIGSSICGKDGTEQRVRNVWRGPQYDAMLDIYIETQQTPGEHLILTKDHPLWVKGPDGVEKWKRAGDCGLEDKLQTLQHGWVRIAEMRETAPCSQVYNLELEQSGTSRSQGGTMYCNGILTGDHQVQNSNLEG